MTTHTTRERIILANDKSTNTATSASTSPTSSTKNKASRIPFTEEEDLKLRRLVGVFGENCWRVISLNMSGRTAKQCKDRYFNSLAPNIENGEWTSEEEDLLREKVETHGTRWSIIAKFFTNRGPNNIKNHWNRVLSKKKPINITKKEPSVKRPIVFNDNFDYFDAFNFENDWAMIDTL